MTNVTEKTDGRGACRQRRRERAELDGPPIAVE